MPGPPTINWYRADLRSPLPGGLSRPADHLYQSLLFFFPSPFPFFPSAKCKVRSIGRRAEWTAGENGESRRVNCSTCIDVTGTHSSGALGDTHACHVNVCVIMSICVRLRAPERAFRSFLCRLLSLTSSPFPSSSPSPLPFALLVALLSNLSLFSLLPFLLLLVIQGEGERLYVFHAV